MTSVYSGGLAYEYTVEPNGYGLVEVSSSGSIEPNDDFKRLKAAYEKTSNPRGDGGYKKDGKASECPPASEDWEVETSDLPATPKKAEAFMDKGAGKAVGLTGEGSHFAGEASESTAPSGSGSSSSSSGQSNGGSGSGAGESNAAGALELPVRGLAMVAASVVFSAALLL
jgi:curved DNA-binding protein CbpA